MEGRYLKGQKIMKIIKGNLIKLAHKFDIIVHGCNCFCTMGAGIALQIKTNFPEAYQADQQTTQGDMIKLGKYTHAIISPQLTVINAYTQYRYGPNTVNYLAIRSVFKQIKLDFSGQRIGYPKIGAGLAGGDWSKISEIIDTELRGEDHTLIKLEKK